MLLEKEKSTVISIYILVASLVRNVTLLDTSYDVLPSKNQALCEYCTHLNQLKHC